MFVTPTIQASILEVPVLAGDTVGLFCQRYGLRRETLFEANPHLRVRAFVLEDGTWTAELEEGELLATVASRPEGLRDAVSDTNTKFRAFPEADYRKLQECIASNRVPDDEGPDHFSCHELKQENGKTYAKMLDGTWVEFDNYEFFKKEYRPCFLADGAMSEGGGPCYKTGFQDGQFGVFKDQIVDYSAFVEAKDEGISTGVWIGVGVVSVLAVGGLFALLRG